jgi:signal transduction histidine kinase
VRSRWIPVVAFGLLAGAFAIDVATPQSLVVAILFDVPIALAALAVSRRLTTTLVVLSLVADALAGYINGVQEGGRWDAIGIGDRLLAALSIVLVGYLSVVVQERARRAGVMAAQEQRTRREAVLAGAVDTVRATLSYDLVLRAIVRAAPDVLSGDGAWWLPAERNGELLRLQGTEIEVRSAPPGPEVPSLVRRALDVGDVETLGEDDAVSRMLLDALGARAALAAPFVDRERAYGVLVVTAEQPFDDVTTGLARAFMRAGTAALANAHLFAQLAERNDALSERGAVIRDLVYALSHDLRTPLAALEMTLAQAHGGAYGELPPRYRAILESSILATEDLQRLADTLLRIARFESGEHRPERERVDVGALARQIGTELEALAHSRGVGLQVTGNDGIVAVADRGDLRRAIANLAANALENTAAGGTVSIAVDEKKGAARVVVSDDGFGLSGEARAHLFQRFAGSASSAGGTGLGLYLVQRVAEDAGGSVTYAPRNPRGSTFTIALPAAVAAIAAQR